MNSIELDSNPKSKVKFIVVAQSPANEENIKHPLKNTESGRRFTMWLEAAGLLNETFDITNAIKRVIRPGETPTAAEQALALNELNNELQPFKYVICLGKVAANAVTKLEFKDKYILNLPHPSGLNRNLNDPQEVENVISALRTFKSKL